MRIWVSAIQQEHYMQRQQNFQVEILQERLKETGKRNLAHLIRILSYNVQPARPPYNGFRNLLAAHASSLHHRSID
jgi:hypothetical protein